METSVRSGPHPGLLDWLRVHRIEHEVHEHDLAFTSRQTARVEGVDPHTFVKVVGVETEDGRRALVAVEATDHVDLGKARRVLGTTRVRLLDEAELTALAPSCDTGAIPAVGTLFGLPLYADYAIREQSEISFNAGSHEYSVRVDRAAWEAAADVAYADLAAETDPRPAWARS